jgi:hypothetical protein
VTSFGKPSKRKPHLGSQSLHHDKWSEEAMSEYDWKRLAGRLSYTLLFGFLTILALRDILPSPYHPPLPCSGGPKEALQFLTELLVAAVIIEVSSAAFWQLARRVRLVQASKTNHNRSLFAPWDSAFALIVGLAVSAAAGKLHFLPNPCDDTLLDWKQAARYFLLAFGFLTLACALPRPRSETTTIHNS